MCVTGLFLCLPLTMRPLDEFWVGATSVTATRNSWPSGTYRRRVLRDDGKKANFTLIIDNYSTHKPRKSIAAAASSSAFIFISISHWQFLAQTWSSCSYYRGHSEVSVRQLPLSTLHLAEHNKEPKPFTWTASADLIFV